MIARKTAAAGLIGILIGGAAVALIGFQLGQGGADKQRIEAVVRDYVLANPEIIPQAMERLQAREAGKAVAANRAAFETPFAGAWAGAEDGDVVLVELFDYACGFCRKSNADIDRLLAEDPKLKVVWRELPVLGQDSANAAQASLAAAKQGKFRQFYNALFASGRPTPPNIAAALKASGVQPSPVSPDMRQELEKNYELARAVGANGTPTFIVGDKVFQGAVGYEALKQAIAEARSRA